MCRRQAGHLIFVGAVTLGLVGPVVLPGLACAGTPNQSSVGDSETARNANVAEEVESTESSKPMTRDDAYRNVMSSYERLTELWRKPAEESEALLAAAAALRAALEALNRVAEAQEKEAEASRYHVEVGAATVAPSGPATASAEPSSPEAVEARERATDQWHTVAIPEAGSTSETLASVSAERIRDACAEAGEHLARLHELWRSESPDQTLSQAGLSELERILSTLPGPSKDH